MGQVVGGSRWRGLIAVQLISMGAMEMSNPFWPMYLPTLAGGSAWQALAGTYVLPMLGMALTSVWWGRIGDRHGHKWMMVRALCGLALTQLALACSTSVAEVLAWRLLQGMLAGFIAPAQAYGVALLRGASPYALFAALQVATNLGSLLGATLGGFLWERLPFAWLNLSAGFVCALCALGVAWRLPDMHPGKRLSTPGAPSGGTGGHHVAVAGAAVSAGMAMPALALPLLSISGLIAVLGLLVGARMVTQVPFSLYASEVLAMDKLGVGFSYGLMALGFAVAAPVWARCFAALDDVTVLRRQLLVTAGLAVMGAGLGMARGPWAFGAGQFLWGSLIAASTPVLTALVSRRSSPAQRGRVLGWVQSATQVCSVAGIGLGAWLVQRDALVFTFAGVACIYLIGLALLAFVLVRAGGGLGRKCFGPGV